MVTIILGILAAVAIPRYVGVVDKAEEAAESSAKQRWSEGKGISKADTRDEF